MVDFVQVLKSAFGGDVSANATQLPPPIPTGLTKLQSDSDGSDTHKHVYSTCRAGSAARLFGLYLKASTSWVSGLGLASRFPYLEIRVMTMPHPFTVMLRRWNELVHVKLLEQCLASRRHSISIIITSSQHLKRMLRCVTCLENHIILWIRKLRFKWMKCLTWEQSPGFLTPRPVLFYRHMDKSTLKTKQQRPMTPKSGVNIFVTSCQGLDKIKQRFRCGFFFF